MASLFETIWTGGVHKNEEHMSGLKNKFLANLDSKFKSSQHITDQIAKAASDEERVQLFKSCFEWVSISDKIAQTFKKCSSLSTRFRESGNLEYKSGNTPKAVRAYNLAIVWAPPGSEELSLGFGNRSAVFAQTSEWKLALQDIHLAFENGIPKHLHEKLDQRKQKCVKSLTKTAEAHIGAADAAGIGKRLFWLRSPHPRIRSVEDFIDICYDVNCGRRLIATKDVDAGTIICVEEPYVTVLDKELEWDLEHCHNCYRRIRGGIPCPVCTFAIFCDEICLAAAMCGPHQFDHFISPYFHSHEVLHYSDLMSLRIVTKTGPRALHEKFLNSRQAQQSGRLENGASNSAATATTASISGFSQNGVYESSYHQIYNLFAPSVTASIAARTWTADALDDFVSNIFKAFVLSNLLNELTTFFSTPPLDDTAFRDFITCLLFHHLESIKCNAMSFSELLRVPSSSASRTSTAVSSTFAVGLFPTISLANHSCCPNTIHIRNARRCVTSLVALQPLRAGDEVTITYGPKFQARPTLERQCELERKFRFKCACQACGADNNWSPESVITSADEGIDLLLIKRRCQKCSAMPKPLPVTQEIRCTSCLATILEVNAQLQKYESELRELYAVIKEYENKFLESARIDDLEGACYWSTIERLKSCLQFFGAHFKPTFNLVQIAQDLFKKVVVYVMAQNS